MKLKVNNLRHIHDHGLAVSFSDPKLSALIASALAKAEGVQTLRAGESHVTVTKLGNVTRTQATFAADGWAGRDISTIHYFDPSNGLKYSLSREGTNQKQADEDAHDTLCAVVFGSPDLPRVWSPANGTKSDDTQTWLKSWAWTLTGAQGMRAQAMLDVGKLPKANVSSAKNGLSYHRRELDRLTEHTSERFRERHEHNRTSTEHKLGRIAESKALAEADLAFASDRAAFFNDKERMLARARDFGADSRYDYDTNTTKIGWQGTADSTTPAYVRPNYSATVDEQGRIILSSGIICEFTLPTVLAWLRGESAAPATRYGQLRRVETRDENGQPRVLLVCGCHDIDASLVSAELAELLKPKHTVETVKGTTSCYWEDDKEAFRVRLLEEISAHIAKCDKQRAEILVAQVETKHQLETEEARLPILIAEQTERVTRAEAELAECERKLAELVPPLGASAEALQTIALKAVTSLTLKTFLT